MPLNMKYLTSYLQDQVMPGASTDLLAVTPTLGCASPSLSIRSKLVTTETVGCGLDTCIGISLKHKQCELCKVH